MSGAFVFYAKDVAEQLLVSTESLSAAEVENETRLFANIAQATQQVFTSAVDTAIDVHIPFDTNRICYTLMLKQINFFFTAV